MWEFDENNKFPKYIGEREFIIELDFYKGKRQRKERCAHRMDKNKFEYEIVFAVDRDSKDSHWSGLFRPMRAALYFRQKVVENENN